MPRSFAGPFPLAGERRWAFTPVSGRLVEAGDTRLFVHERGDGALPLFVLHGELTGLGA